ncbi:MAG: hypothetical protein JXA94_03600 [Parachlamydiales bacterium]|nr:hypothetical protein [Parachlamydiales bacterium]
MGIEGVGNSSRSVFFEEHEDDSGYFKSQKFKEIAILFTGGLSVLATCYLLGNSDSSNAQSTVGNFKGHQCSHILDPTCNQADKMLEGVVRFIVNMFKNV